MTRKIIILTPGCTGSRLLVSSLNQHSQIKPNLEFSPYEPLNGIFHNTPVYKDYVEKRFNIDLDDYGLNIWNKKYSEIYTKIFDYNTIDYIFSNQTIIKCKYDQFRRSYILDYILNNNVSIIHLCRINISSIILRVKKEKHRDLRMINMTSKIFDRLFHTIMNTERLIDSIQYSKIKIYYENLISNWDFFIKKIQKFCYLPFENINMSSNKAIKPKRCELYSNNQVSEYVKKNYNKEYWSISK